MLEDHAGDIICKARQAAHISLESAARAAEIPVAELAAMEKSGQAGAKLNLIALAKLVGLDASRLEAIFQGWQPEPADVGQWRELRQIVSAQGGNTVNCYLVWDEVTKEAALFDTGWEAGEIFRLVTDNNLELRHLFFTHHHEDHVAALGAIHNQFTKIRLHTGSKTAPPDQRNRANDFIHLGSLRITHRDTPGHSEDGVTYIIGGFPEDAPHVAVVGDALFAGSMGRGFQSSELLRQKVRDQILTLPAETLLCPGHGPLTTVAQERSHNPFFGQNG